MSEKERPTKKEIAFSVGLVPAAVVVAAVLGWAAIRITPLFILGIFLPAYMIGMSCAGARTFKGEAPVNP